MIWNQDQLLPWKSPDQCEISFLLVDFWSISCLTFLLSPLLGCNSFPIRCCNGQEIQLGNCQQIQQASISSGNKSLAEFGNKSKSDDIEANNEAWDLIAVAGTISKSEWARRNLIAVSTLWIGLLLASPHQITLRQSLKLKLYGDQKGVTKRISSMQRGNKKPKKDALTWSKLLQEQESNKRQLLVMLKKHQDWYCGSSLRECCRGE